MPRVSTPWADGGPDLIVAGAGGGLVGALRAAQFGLSVLVVEVSEHYQRGNNTSMSTAMVPGAGTRWQQDAGIADSAELFLADIMAKSKGGADEPLARALADVSARLVTWLAEDAHLPLSLVTDFPYPGHSRLRCHTVPGRKGSGMLAALAEQAVRSEAVEMLVPARMIDAVSNDGSVRAAVVEYPDGSREEIGCRALLLATNGYGADPELVRRHIPEIADAHYFGSDQSRGDALRIGSALGADTAYLDSYQGHAALALPAGTFVGWATVMHGGVLVNSEGHRFGDETTGYSEYAAALLAQPGGTGHLVFDRRIYDDCLSFQDFRETVDAGAVKWAADQNELATHLGVDQTTLAGTLSAASTAARGGTDRFGRTNWERALEAPYATVRVSPALFHTQGGLRVDGHARVLDGAASPIRGLYASGGAAMGISGHGASGYLAGNGLLPALGLAFLAAEDLANTSRTRVE